MEAYKFNRVFSINVGSQKGTRGDDPKNGSTEIQHSARGHPVPL